MKRLSDLKLGYRGFSSGKNYGWEYEIKIGGAHYKDEALLYSLEILR